MVISDIFRIFALLINKGSLIGAYFLLMKKLLLQLQGYKLIDIVAGEWSHIFLDVEGNDITFVDYAYYHIFYNPKKDKYKFLLSGFRPYMHCMYGEMNSIIDFINMKPDGAQIHFTKTSQDFFFQKNELFKMVDNNLEISINTVNGSETDNQVRVLRMDLEHYKNFLESINIDDAKLIKVMQTYKKEVLAKRTDIEIYQDLGNVVITSEGCYFTAYNKHIQHKDGSDSQENSGE